MYVYEFLEGKKTNFEPEADTKPIIQSIEKIQDPKSDPKEQH